MTDRNFYSAIAQPRKAAAAPETKKPTPTPTLHDLLSAALGQRQMARIGEWSASAERYVRSPFYVITEAAFRHIASAYDENVIGEALDRMEEASLLNPTIALQGSICSPPNALVMKS
jgi:hypothetical protein